MVRRSKIVALLLLLMGLGFGARKGYIEAEVEGCKKTAMYGVEQAYGPAPEDVKAKILLELDKECRQIL